jgi:hypothetical protein
MYMAEEVEICCTPRGRAAVWAALEVLNWYVADASDVELPPSVMPETIQHVQDFREAAPEEWAQLLELARILRCRTDMPVPDEPDWKSQVQATSARLRGLA